MDIQMCNTTLERILAELHGVSGTFFQDDGLSKGMEIIEILYSIIEESPATVNAISIDLSLSDRQFSSERKKVISQFGSVFQFVFPLPYAFDTGTHGSGQRKANAMSYRVVFVETNGKGSIDFILNFDPSYRLNVHCDLQEVENIRLISWDDHPRYTPLITADGVQEAPTPLLHYLTYRGFSYVHLPQTEKDAKVISLAKDFLVPEIGTHLWELHEDSQCIPKSFSAYVFNYSKGILYQFDNCSLPLSLQNITTFGAKYIALAAVHTLLNGSRDQVIEYKGRQAIQELSSHSLKRLI